ncbi:MAG: 30S ribosomal protein S5 [Candidatus Bathyarchaeia archaeon]
MSTLTEEAWVPRTKLGRMVAEGKLTSLEEVFFQGLRIQESEIVDRLLPDIKNEVLTMDIVQKQTDAGEQSRFKVIVIVGNGNGYIGIGTGKAKQIRTGIEKATKYAKLNITPIKRGCGSWECGCDQPHSLPFKTTGKRGSVRIDLLPAPRGLGLVASSGAAVILRMAGISDCWSRTFGSTKTTSSLAFAAYEALRNTFRVVTPRDWVR